MEQRLCSPGSEFSRLSPRFVCVRLYYTAQGASEPFAKLGLGDPRGPRNNVDIAFLAPDGRNIDVRSLKPMTGPGDGVWVRDIVSTEKNQAGDGEEIVATAVDIMRKLVKLHPGKRDVPSVPWQVSLSHAVFVSAWDSLQARNGLPRDPRRILVAPGPIAALEDADLLRKFERHYVFVKVEPDKAPLEWKEKLAGGALILDVAKSVNGFGKEQDPARRSYPPLVAEGRGAWTTAKLSDFLRKHVAPVEGPR